MKPGQCWRLPFFFFFRFCVRKLFKAQKRNHMSSSVDVSEFRTKINSHRISQTRQQTTHTVASCSKKVNKNVSNFPTLTVFFHCSESHLLAILPKLGVLRNLFFVKDVRLFFFDDVWKLIFLSSSELCFSSFSEKVECYIRCQVCFFLQNSRKSFGS